MTKEELLVRLRLEDPSTLLEFLELSSDDIVDMALEKIEEREEELFAYYEEAE